jgi:hypothetical protein
MEKEQFEVLMEANVDFGKVCTKLTDGLSRSSKQQPMLSSIITDSLKLLERLNNYLEANKPMEEENVETE